MFRCSGRFSCTASHPFAIRFFRTDKLFHQIQDLFFSLTGDRRKRNDHKLLIRRTLQHFPDPAGLDPDLRTADLVRLCRNNDRYKSAPDDPVIHQKVMSARTVPDIDQQKDSLQLRGSVQIALDHDAPFFHLCSGSLRISVSGQIHQEKPVIHQVKVYGLCFTGRRARPCERFPVQQGVDQCRFPDIGFSGECNLRHRVFRQDTGHPAYCLQTCASDDHMNVSFQAVIKIFP